MAAAETRRGEGGGGRESVSLWRLSIWKEHGTRTTTRRRKKKIQGEGRRGKWQGTGGMLKRQRKKGDGIKMTGRSDGERRTEEEFIRRKANMNKGK